MEGLFGRSPANSVHDREGSSSLFTSGQVDLFVLKAVIACAGMNEYSTNIPRKAAALRHV